MIQYNNRIIITVLPNNDDNTKELRGVMINININKAAILKHMHTFCVDRVYSTTNIETLILNCYIILI